MSLQIIINETNKEFINFTILNDQEGLPFPLYLNNHWKIVIVASLLIIIIQGTRLRKVIISYIKSPEAKLGPINYLILVDQINGIPPAFVIIMRIVFILSPISGFDLLGPFACALTEFVAAVYLGAALYWNCSIAVFRVLFIKAQKWLNKTVGIKTMLVTMLLFGFVLIFTFALLTVTYDKTSSIKKMCFHLSEADMEIMEAYKVILSRRHSYIGSMVACHQGGPSFKSQQG